MAMFNRATDRLRSGRGTLWGWNIILACLAAVLPLGVRWMDKHPDKATPERLLLIYAWNENGEGGYLTPTAGDGVEYLKAVERAITVDH